MNTGLTNIRLKHAPKRIPKFHYTITHYLQHYSDFGIFIRVMFYLTLEALNPIACEGGKNDPPSIKLIF